MSAAFRRTLAAEEDLMEIFRWIERDNPRAANRMVDKIEAVCRMLAEHPFAGVARDDLRQGSRLFPAHPYLVIYRIVEENMVEVVRVLHGARDLPKLLS